MTSSSTFQPLWASPPGRTIETRLRELDLSAADLGNKIGQSPAAVDELLRGSMPITVELAARLASVLGASPAFWFTRDCRYRESLERADTKAWVDTMPYNAMVNAGWLKAAREWPDRSVELFRFFGVRDLPQWQAIYPHLIASAHLRTSAKATVVDAALAAWLRSATEMADRQDVPTFRGDVLRAKVDGIRALTRVAAPESFLPRLAAELASAGVAFVALPAIPGSPINGAARVLPDGRAMLAVSGRYLADDQLWFTVFHEIGHLLFHADRGLYLDDLSDHAAVTQDEIEANRFAGETLFPSQLRSSLPKGRLGLRDVVGYAKAAGISPGVLVGQLQFDEQVPHDHWLNRAKRRYKWNGSILRSG